MSKRLRRFSGTRFDRMPNETVSPLSRVPRSERKRTVESMAVPSVGTPRPARGKSFIEDKKSPHADWGVRAAENHAGTVVSFATATSRENAA